MAFELVIKHGAQVDAQEAYDFYEAEQPGLGDRFADE